MVKRQKGPDGLPIGTAHANPLLDTRMYTVEYLDGHQAALTANQIAKNLFAQVDDHKKLYILIDEITDHWSDNTAIPELEAYFITLQGT